MKLIRWCLLLIGISLGRGAIADSYSFASELERAGNSWQQGEPIPPQLLAYRPSYEKYSCFPNPDGTEMIFQGITNFALLREVMFLPHIDARVFSNAVNSALHAEGPTRFFQAVQANLDQKPQLGRGARIKALTKQSKVKHIVVDSLYITFADMPPADAGKVLEDIRSELQNGKKWHDVYWKFMEQYEFPYEQKLTDGTVIKGKRTRVGNLGDFILAANNNPLFTYREEWMPKAHVKRLFAANVGDVLILWDKEDLSRFPDLKGKETGERQVLYQVREVYRGK
jgi:hypothetical protein